MHMEKALHYFSSDAIFDSLFPIHIRQLSAIHWTPLQVAFKAAAFLVTDIHSCIIDVGAGAGKFCIAGSHCFSNSFTGIEQRKDLATTGNKVISRLGIQNAKLLCSNSTTHDLSAYTGIYFYNSFHENLILSDNAEGKIQKSGALYDLYTAHLMEQLIAMPTGTRLATYWLSVPEVPGCYNLQEAHFNGLLKLWIKH
jgi:hypothetical protein